MQACKKQTQKETRKTRARSRRFGQTKSGSGERSKTRSKTSSETSSQVQRSERIRAAKRGEKEIKNGGEKAREKEGKKRFKKMVLRNFFGRTFPNVPTGTRRYYSPYIFLKDMLFYINERRLALGTWSLPEKRGKLVLITEKSLLPKR